MAARSALLRAVLAARHTLAIRNTTTTGGGVGGGGLWEARAACARAASTSSASAVSASASAPPPKKQRPAATLHMGTVDVPEGVTVSLDGDILTLTGPLGTSTTSLSRLDGRGDGAVRVGAGGRAIEVASVSKPFYGTLASLLRSKIEGVTRGFLVYLRITGIGYRASLSGQTLTLKLGHSHDCTYTLPPSLRAVLPEPTRVGIYGIDRNQVTQAAANIVALRPPSVYKGKGVRLEGTEVRLKPGKRK